MLSKIRYSLFYLPFLFEYYANAITIAISYTLQQLIDKTNKQNKQALIQT